LNNGVIIAHKPGKIHELFVVIFESTKIRLLINGPQDAIKLGVFKRERSNKKQQKSMSITRNYIYAFSFRISASNINLSALRESI